MKKLTILFLFIFSFINAQVSEKINLPDFYNAQLGRMICTQTIKDVTSILKSEGLQVDLIEADEHSILYMVNLINNQSKQSLNLRVYFYDTYILINSFNYNSEIEKIINGKKFYVDNNLDAEYKSKINLVLDEFVKNGFIKTIKTQIWR